MKLYNRHWIKLPLGLLELAVYFVINKLKTQCKTVPECLDKYYDDFVSEIVSEENTETNLNLRVSGAKTTLLWGQCVQVQVEKQLQGCLGQSGRKGWEMTLFWRAISSHQGTLFLQGYFNLFMLVIKDIYSSFAVQTAIWSLKHWAKLPYGWRENDTGPVLWKQKLELKLWFKEFIKDTVSEEWNWCRQNSKENETKQKNELSQRLASGLPILCPGTSSSPQ